MNGLVDDRFSGLKHFWSAVAVDRPRKLKKFEENIELYRPEGDFDEEDIIQYTVELTGVFPMSEVMNSDIMDKLYQNMIPPIGEFDPDLRVTWFIPRKIVHVWSIIMLNRHFTTAPVLVCYFDLLVGHTQT